MLVLEHRVVIRVEIPRQRGQTERREEGVLDRAEPRIVRLQQRRQDELHVHAIPPWDPAAGVAGDQRVVGPKTPGRPDL